MAKFFGKIGFREQKEIRPGVWENEITEYSYVGDIIRNVRRLPESDKVLNDLTLMNSISIVADAYAREHFFAIAYVEWAGAVWTVTHVEVESPRLILRLGSVYNGPRPAAPDPSGA